MYFKIHFLPWKGREHGTSVLVEQICHYRQNCAVCLNCWTRQVKRKKSPYWSTAAETLLVEYLTRDAFMTETQTCWFIKITYCRSQSSSFTLWHVWNLYAIMLIKCSLFDDDVYKSDNFLFSRWMICLVAWHVFSQGSSQGFYEVSEMIHV